MFFHPVILPNSSRYSVFCLTRCIIPLKLMFKTCTGTVAVCPHHVLAVCPALCDRPTNTHRHHGAYMMMSPWPTFWVFTSRSPEPFTFRHLFRHPKTDKMRVFLRFDLFKVSIVSMHPGVSTLTPCGVSISLLPDLLQQKKPIKSEARSDWLNRSIGPSDWLVKI